MTTRRIALIQFDAHPENPQRNLAEMERLAREAASQDARWILFHEGTLCDYTPRVAELAEAVPGGTACGRIESLASELGCFISFGLTEQRAGLFHITQAFHGPDGFFHAYRKTWLWHGEDEGYRDEWTRYDPGTGPELFEIDGVRATCFICADGCAPRCIDRAADLKPQVVFYPNNRQSLPEFSAFGEIAKRIRAPMLVTNRVGHSWSSDCRGGCTFYSATGDVLAAANRDGREEILIHDLRIPDLKVRDLSLQEPASDRRRRDRPSERAERE